MASICKPMALLLSRSSSRISGVVPGSLRIRDLLLVAAKSVALADHHATLFGKFSQPSKIRIRDSSTRRGQVIIFKKVFDIACRLLLPFVGNFRRILTTSDPVYRPADSARDLQLPVFGLRERYPSWGLRLVRAPRRPRRRTPRVQRANEPDDRGNRVHDWRRDRAGRGRGSPVTSRSAAWWSPP